MENDNPLPTHEGKWQCSKCQTEITELPFEPDGERPLFCPECYRAQKQKNHARGPRKVYKGNWTCSQCQTGIAELPFEPDDPGKILCYPCHQKKKASGDAE